MKERARVCTQTRQMTSHNIKYKGTTENYLTATTNVIRLSLYSLLVNNLKTFSCFPQSSPVYNIRICLDILVLLSYCYM